MAIPKTPESIIKVERLREVLDYDPQTGIFIWKVRLSKNVPPGREAGKVGVTGYRYVRVDKLDYLAQRLAWLYVYGVWPGKLLRFQNGDKTDCRISNLYEGVWLDTKHDHNTPEGRSAYQKEFRKAYPEHVKGHDLKKVFGINYVEYKRMSEAQGNVCAICSCPETDVRDGKLKMLAVDHCHDSNKIRGLLCTGCNTGLGKFRDDRVRLQAAIDYLDKHKDCAK